MNPAQLQLDVIGTICGLVTTACFVGAYKIAWPLSLITLVLDSVLFWQSGLYGDFLLQMVYFSMTLYGWWQWSYGGTKGVAITRITRRQTWYSLVIAVLGIGGVFLLLRNYTDSQVPWLDALTTVLSLIAFWLSCRKIIQCWLVWFLVDSLYIGMYFYKAVPAHAILNVVYLGMAVSGYVVWRRKAIKNQY